MSNREDAVATLNTWLAERNESFRVTDGGDWVVSEYRDAFVVGPSGGRRSNLLFVVRGSRVGCFSPAAATLEATYTNLGDGLGTPESD